MKIAIFSDAFLPIVSGVVTATLNMAEGLADKGHKIYIIAPAYKDIKEFKYPNVKVVRVKSVPALICKNFKITSIFSFKLFKYLKNEGIDVVHFVTPLTLGVEAILTAKALKVPLVGTFHTFSSDKEFLKKFRLDYNYFQNMSWGFNRLFYNRCDLITCPAKTTKEELLSNKFRGNIKVISNGIDPAIFDNSDRKNVKKRYNAKGKLLLFVGRVDHEKNILHLLDSFAVVVKNVPETKLLIVGGGPLMAAVKNRINALGIENNVILTGEISHDKFIKASIFKACDLFVTASVTENQPMTVLEAQANGLVCVGIDARGMKDLIVSGYNGYLSEVDNPEAFAGNMIKLISDDNLRLKMQQNTNIMVRQHNLKNVISAWEETYNTLIDGVKSSGLRFAGSQQRIS